METKAARPVPGRVRAAIVHRVGTLPRAGVTELPGRRAGTTVVRVIAAALNPLDLGMAAGALPGFRYDEPYVPGIECTGVVEESDRFAAGDLVYGECRPSPRSPGCFASHAVLEDDSVVKVLPGLDPVLAVAVGNAGIAAFMPLIGTAALRGGECVLVLGATGTVGRLAVQICREHGAGQIVAVGRDRQALNRARELGAHVAVELRHGETPGELADRLRACAPSPDIVLDSLFGVPLEAALQVCAAGARVVNIGNQAGPEAVIPAGLLRAKQLSVTGFASFLMPLQRKLRALEWMWSALSRDRLQVDVSIRLLDDLPAAWREQQASPHAKIVIAPGEQTKPFQP